MFKIDIKVDVHHTFVWSDWKEEYDGETKFCNSLQNSFYVRIYGALIHCMFERITKTCWPSSNELCQHLRIEVKCVYETNHWQYWMVFRVLEYGPGRR